MLWIDDKLCKKEKDNNTPKFFFTDGVLAENKAIDWKTISYV